MSNLDISNTRRIRTCSKHLRLQRPQQHKFCNGRSRGAPMTSANHNPAQHCTKQAWFGSVWVSVLLSYSWGSACDFGMFWDHCVEGYNFGNGYYNDHHFHYGYFVYSAAVPLWNGKCWVWFSGPLEDSRISWSFPQRSFGMYFFQKKNLRQEGHCVVVIWSRHHDQAQLSLGNPSRILETLPAKIKRQQTRIWARTIYPLRGMETYHSDSSTLASLQAKPTKQYKTFKPTTATSYSTRRS